MRKNSSSFSRRFKSTLHFFSGYLSAVYLFESGTKRKILFSHFLVRKVGNYLWGGSWPKHKLASTEREREKIYPGIKRPYVRNNPLLCCPFKSPLLICQCWPKEKRRGKGVLISSNLRQIGARRNGKYYFFGKNTEYLFGKRKRKKYFMMKTSPLSPVFGRPKILVAFSSFSPFFFMAARACVVSASISVLTSGEIPDLYIWRRRKSGLADLYYLRTCFSPLLLGATAIQGGSRTT